MTLAPSTRDDEPMSPPDLRAFVRYLHGAGWQRIDEDDRTSLWRPAQAEGQSDIRVVLPARQEVIDYADRVQEALRAVAYVERRLPHEISGDMEFGGADTLAVKLTPDAPPGEAPLELAHAAVEALRNLIVASATALDVKSLVLPLRRPQRAEAYAKRARLSTLPGSFVLSVALPLFDLFDETQPQSESEDGALIQRADLPQVEPFGRRVTNRLMAAASTAQTLADHVNAGTKRIETFGESRPHAPNATELAALAALGGPDRDLYQLRIAKSPLATGPREPVRTSITPGQQRLFAEAADYLRTKQPRSGVTVVGLVVRLYRSSKFGPGKVVIQGVDDDTGSPRRFQVELVEDDYNNAVQAHAQGLQVTAVGDLEVRGTHLSLRRLTTFQVIPGLDDE